MSKRGIGMTAAMVAIVGVFFGFSVLAYMAAAWLPVKMMNWVPGHPEQSLSPAWAGVISSAANFLLIMLVAVMIIATFLTLAERKWSAFMQDRVGPNRARIAGINRPLAGIPHMLSDIIKMLTKEGFVPDEADFWIYKLAPIINFAPIFCLFAIVPVGPRILAGTTMDGRAYHAGLQVSHADFGLLYLFALASIAVYGTVLAGWASSNKFAMMGGVRATSQMISYEVALGLSLVGMMCVANTMRLDFMVDTQAAYIWTANFALLGHTFDFGLPAWGIFLQPVGFVLFFTAAFAETKRAPFDLPEGESEVIGYFVEYAGMGFGLFMITEFVEVVVLSAITAAIFFGGYHLPFGEQWLHGVLDPSGHSLWGELLWGSALATAFWVKVMLLCYVQLAVRWSFPRFRYDQIQRLGWQMLLPAGLINVFVSAALVLWDPSLKALTVVGLVEIAAILALIPRPKKDEAPAPSLSGHGAVAAHGGGH